MSMELPQAGPNAGQSDGPKAAPQRDQGPPPDAPLKEKVVHQLQQVYDPEIPVNIYELGLIYKVDVKEDTGYVHVEMTLTTPNCPEAQTLPQYAQTMVEALDEVSECDVQIVWDPPWDREMMSEEAKFMLGMM